MMNIILLTGDGNKTGVAFFTINVSVPDVCVCAHIVYNCMYCECECVRMLGVCVYVCFLFMHVCT